VEAIHAETVVVATEPCMEAKAHIALSESFEVTKGFTGVAGSSTSMSSVTVPG
jgi:hypothetical protein